MNAVSRATQPSYVMGREGVIMSNKVNSTILGSLTQTGVSRAVKCTVGAPIGMSSLTYQIELLITFH